MVTKKAWGLLGITASLVLGGAVCYADNTKTRSTPAPKVRTAVYQAMEPATPPAKEVKPVRQASLDLGAAKPCPTETATFATPEKCCVAPTRSLWCKFWDWLTYRPVTHISHCGRENICTPPLFSYYLGGCPLPPAPKIASPAPAYRDGHCATKPAKDDEEKEGFSLLPSYLFGRSSEKRAAKPATEKGAENAQVKQDDVQPAGRKVTVEVKKVEEVQLPQGKESSKWRGMPQR